MFRINPMSPEVADAVIDAAAEYKTLDGAKARRVAERWLVARGFTRDAWGNFKKSGVIGRYHFTKTKLQRQEKVAGRWRSIDSRSIIDVAHNLVQNAAAVSPRASEVAHLVEAKRKRKVAKKKAAARRVSERIRDEARVMAFRRALHQHWQLAYRALVLGDRSEVAEANEKIIPLVEKLRPELEQQLLEGKVPRQPPYSTDKPPLAVLFRDETVQFTEKVGGVGYTVRMRNRARGEVVIELGSLRGLTVDPVTHQVYHSAPDAVGDAYISGVLEVDQKRRAAVLFYIMSHDKRTGAGGRILSLWCDLMAGYGIDLWAAQAVGAEGRLFFKALERRGKLRIVKRDGANMIIECVRLSPNRAVLRCG